MSDVPLRQPPETPETPEDPTKGTFGPVEPRRKPDAERGRYDVPSRAEDDFAIDEQRIRRRVTPPPGRMNRRTPPKPRRLSLGPPLEALGHDEFFGTVRPAGPGLEIGDLGEMGLELLL